MADSPDLPPFSPNPAPPQGAPAANHRPPAPSSGLGAGLHALWTLLVRLLVLGVSASVGWLLGLAIAQIFPSRSPNPPIAELALRQSSQTVGKLQQLPRWWQGDSAVDLSSGDLPPVAESPADSASAEPATDQAAADLSSEERDRIQTDLALLQQDLASLDTRLQTLESTLGTPPTGTLEERLNRLDQRLDPPSTSTPAAQNPETIDPGAPDSGATPPPTVTLVPYQEPLFPLVSDRILLPSVLLFEPGSSILTGPGQQLLDSIAADLRRYGPVTLLVGSHTDPAIVTDGASQLTLQQSLAVQQHLAPQIEGPRWVPLGYGYSRPRTIGTTLADQQRNQRVEIGVVPRS